LRQREREREGERERGREGEREAEKGFTSDTLYTLHPLSSML
jgi:hypothetical protein